MMEFAFFDESGDLGANGSKFLVLCLLCTPDKKHLSKIINETKKHLLDNHKNSKWLARHGGEIKFYGFPDKLLLKRVLKELSQINGHVYYVPYPKNSKKVHEILKTQFIGILFKHIKEKNNQKPEKILADSNFINCKKIMRYALNEFEIATLDHKDDEVEKQGYMIGFTELDDSVKLSQEERKTWAILEIEHANSALSPELQALDLICGSIFCKHEHDNDEYFNILGSGKLKIKAQKITDIK